MKSVRNSSISNHWSFHPAELPEMSILAGLPLRVTEKSLVCNNLADIAA
jgi:hypothetical protein